MLQRWSAGDGAERRSEMAWSTADFVAPTSLHGAGWCRDSLKLSWTELLAQLLYHGQEDAGGTDDDRPFEASDAGDEAETEQ
mmetsp:Transcript_53064/g.72662  ORF Transcript_53064/g.72662 Transcript_53064/m.72662 type:complete len:82 (+) Transcript_53064:1-246(+)